MCVKHQCFYRYECELQSDRFAEAYSNSSCCWGFFKYCFTYFCSIHWERLPFWVWQSLRCTFSLQNFIFSSLMQHFLSCKAPFMRFLNYILYYAWVCFLTLAQTKIETLFRRLTGSCQTLKTEQWCQRQFPRERHTLVLLFKNRDDGVFLPGKCCRRCPLLLLHTVAASSKTFKKEVHCCTAQWTEGNF